MPRDVLRSVFQISKEIQIFLFLQEPLLFFSCGYEGLKFYRTASVIAANLASVEAAMHEKLAEAALISTLFERLQHQAAEADLNFEGTPNFKHKGRYVKLANRPRELALAAKFAKFGRTLAQPGAVQMTFGDD